MDAADANLCEDQEGTFLDAAFLAAALRDVTFGSPEQVRVGPA